MNEKQTILEEDLILLLKNNDRKAFIYLYNNYARTLYKVIIDIIGYHDNAKEILQDTFLKIWKNINYFDASKGKLYTWMVHITKNTTIDHIKSKDFKNQLKNLNLPDFILNDNCCSTLLHMDYIGMQNILSLLNPKLKELIDLAYYQGFTHKEIALKLNLPLGTVKTRIRNALLILKTLLRDYN